MKSVDNPIKFLSGKIVLHSIEDGRKTSRVFNKDKLPLLKEFMKGCETTDMVLYNDERKPFKVVLPIYNYKDLCTFLKTEGRLNKIKKIFKRCGM